MAILAYQVTGFAYQGAGLFAYQGSVDAPVGGTTPPVGNNDFWIKGHRQIGQKRKWRYWWEKDPTIIPEEIPVSADVEDVQAESNAVASYITDLVIQRAAEETLKVMRAYYEVLQEQIIARQQTARIEAGLKIIEDKRIKEQAIRRKKKIMLLLNG